MTNFKTVLKSLLFCDHHLGEAKYLISKVKLNETISDRDLDESLLETRELIKTALSEMETLMISIDEDRHAGGRNYATVNTLS